MHSSLRGVCAAFLALALVFCAASALTSCRREEKQIGYTDAAGGYSFSYPESWEAYSAAGGSCISVSDVGGLLPYAIVRFSAFDNGQGLSAEAYWNAGACWNAGKAGAGSVCESCEVQKRECRAFEKEGTASAYEAAVRVGLKGETRLFGQPKKADEAADYMVRQLVFESTDKSRLCVVGYMSTVENDAVYGSVMDGIKESFKFENTRQSGQSGQPEAAADKGLADFEIDTPEGWTLCESEAYCVLRRGNATIVVGVSDAGNSASAELYWEDGYKNAVAVGLVGFEMVSGDDCKPCKLGGQEAIEVHYRGASVSGNVYEFRQRIAVRGGQAYIVTLTASAEDYGEACEGFERLAESLRFR